MTPAQALPDPTSVLVASVGRNMAWHRVLLNVVTACGLRIGPSWVRSAMPYEQVECRDCRESGREFRASRGNA